MLVAVKRHRLKADSGKDTLVQECVMWFDHMG